MFYNGRKKYKQQYGLHYTQRTEMCNNKYRFSRLTDTEVAVGQRRRVVWGGWQTRAYVKLTTLINLGNLGISKNVLKHKSMYIMRLRT